MPTNCSYIALLENYKCLWRAPYMSMNIPPRKEERSYANSLREGAILQVLLLLTQTNPPFNLG